MQGVAKVWSSALTRQIAGFRPNRLKAELQTRTVSRCTLFRHEHFGFGFHLAEGYGVGEALFQNLRKVSRTVQNANNMQSARRAIDAIKNQVVRKPPHRPKANAGKSCPIGSIARADFRPLRQGAKAQLQRGEKSFGGIGIFNCNIQMDIRNVAKRVLRADYFKGLQVP